jgi:hypothetical protein
MWLKYRCCFILAACIAGLLGLNGQARATNWLMLQGTEHPLAPAHRFWGFIQPAYTYDSSDNLSGLTDTPGPPDFSANNGERLAITSVSPWFDEGDRFHVRRARFGVRGLFTGRLRNPFTAKMNYFTLFEVAPNLLTYDPFDDRARTVALDHLSLTFNHIPGARLRAGLFKTPGPEETLQGVHTQDYIEFTDFTAREVIERFVTGAARPAGSPASPVLGVPENHAYGTNGVRDWGLQVFDSFKRKDWDLSYAAMVGRGEAIHETDTTSDTPELYLYASAEYGLPGGWGVHKNGIKFYGWYQHGEREFSSDPTGKDYDRIRYGLGARALGRLFGPKYKYRLGVELMQADGMIFIAPVGGVAQGNIDSGNLQIAAEDGNKARGYTLDLGFYPDNKWQFDLRYHRHDLLYDTASTVNPGNERELTDITLGLNYHFSRKLRLTVNYVFRDVEAPRAYASSGPGGLFPVQAVADGITSNVKNIVSTVDNRFLTQVTWLF